MVGAVLSVVLCELWWEGGLKRERDVCKSGSSTCILSRRGENAMGLRGEKDGERGSRAVELHVEDRERIAQ